MERYLLDSNIFITSENHIPEDIFPSFWVRLGELLASGTAILRQTVLDELRRHRDPLVEWVGGQDGVEAMPTSEGALERYLDVCAWAESQSYTSRAVRPLISPRVTMGIGDEPALTTTRGAWPETAGDGWQEGSALYGINKAL